MIKLPTPSLKVFKVLILGAVLLCPLLSEGKTLLHLRNNWYLAAAGDIAWHNDLKFEADNGGFTEFKYDIGQGTSVSIGKACGPWRTEFEAAYRKSSLDELTVSPFPGFLVSGPATGDVRDFTLMFNGFWDVYIPNSFWIFYLGGGFGVSFHHREATDSTGLYAEKNNNLWAWQGMSGFSYEIIEHTYLSLGYRLFMTAKPRSPSEKANHIVWINNIEFGVRIEL